MKRKRGRPTNSRQPETTLLDNNTSSSQPAVTTAENDVVFSVGNVELINPSSPTTANDHRRRRGRPRKSPNAEPSIPPKPPSVSVQPIANGSVSTAMLNPASAVARVVPAMDSVVKVFCVHTEPNFSLPWQRKRQYSSSSSGFVIRGRRVLTNAHSVEHYTQVKLKKRGSDTKYVATVLAIGTECDIGHSVTRFTVSSIKMPKKKRGGRRKNKEPEKITVLDKVTTVSKDVVFSLSNVELVNPNSSPSSSRQRNRGHFELIYQFPKLDSGAAQLSVLPSIAHSSTQINVEWGRKRRRGTTFQGTEMQLLNTNSLPSSSRPPHHLLNLPQENSTWNPSVPLLTLPPRPGDSTFMDPEYNDSGIAPPLDSVVKVFCMHIEPDFSIPWQRKRQSSSTCSGFMIQGRRIVTNAHSVEHFVHVKIKKRGSDTKYVATVLAVGIECELALLTVHDDEFWEGVLPVEFGDLPALQDAVTVVGYPIGGDTISVTSGVVSRIEILSYVHGSTELLGLQIDAAINSGNSGGPAFNDKGNCVGIAFQSLKHEDVENIGYVIPTPVIMHFIQDYEKNGAYTGFPILGVEWQKMENPDLRLSMGMKPDQKGVRIRRIDPTSPEFHVLKPSDIILSFDSVDIANDGTVPFRHGERIGFSYLVSQKYTGDSATIKVLRNSETLKFNVRLGTHKRLIPAHNKGRPPSYYIIAGFVFTTVSVPYLRSEYGKDYEYEAPVKLLDKLLHEMPQSPDEQTVVVSQVLVADINIGYEEIVNTQVLAFNGQPVKNLKSLARMVESCNDEYLKFDLEYQQIVVLQTRTAKAATLDILSTHCVPSAMSDDLKS